MVCIIVSHAMHGTIIQLVNRIYNTDENDVSLVQQVSDVAYRE